jgi:hypothetical protein
VGSISVILIKTVYLDVKQVIMARSARSSVWEIVEFVLLVINAQNVNLVILLIHVIINAEKDVSTIRVRRFQENALVGHHILPKVNVINVQMISMVMNVT